MTQEIPQTKPVKVLVTGFAPFQDNPINPSWEIARRLPKILPTENQPAGNSISLIVPDDPLPVTYHQVLTLVPALIEQHDPDIIVHIGLNKELKWFAAEVSAERNGYHEIPDEEKKVFTRAENRKIWGKAADNLASTLGLEQTEMGWKEGKKEVDVRLTDDVGNYLCGFVYYDSMLEMQKKKRNRDVLFLHVPMLEREEEFGAGVTVTEELIKAVVGTWKR
ncbi:peptidase C15, pyroglutamyl peptidase I-like protein, partial [Amniculicola lignicola CBS 123094]